MSPESEKKEEVKEEKKEERKIVVPGETIVEGEDYLPGDGTKRIGKEIIAERYGLAEISGRLVRIISLAGSYVPRYGNTIIGKVSDITFNGWIMDIFSPYQAFISLMEVPRFVNKNELAEYFDIGDIIACRITNVKRRSVDLSIKGRGLGKLEGGITLHINSHKVPRVIGKEGSMIKMIKDATNSEIIVGQNGVIWIKSASIENELKAKEAILFVTSKSYIEGLTEKVKEFLEGKKK